jgi:hypothetical protein
LCVTRRECYRTATVRETVLWDNCFEVSEPKLVSSVAQQPAS